MGKNTNCANGKCFAGQRIATFCPDLDTGRSLWYSGQGKEAVTKTGLG